MDKAALIAHLQEMPDDYNVMVISGDGTEAYDIDEVNFDAENDCIAITLYN